MVFIQPGSTLQVWEGTQNWIQLFEKESVQLPGKVSSTQLTFDAADVLVFYGDLIHAGSAYPETNYRLHCYLDLSSCKRPLNVTNLVTDSHPYLASRILEKSSREEGKSHPSPLP